MISKHLQKERLLTLSLVILMAGLGLLQQQFLLFNWDTSWLAHLADRIIQGQKPYQSFFEMNPPLAIYLYYPSVLLTHFIPISLLWSVKLSTFLIGFISLFLSNYFLKNTLSKKHASLRPWLLGILAFTYFVMPATQFTQREHWMIMLVMPYILSLALVIQNNATFKRSLVLKITIGLLAGIGFSIKPFFPITFLLLELYIVIKEKRLVACIRIETLLIVFIMLAYLAAVIIFIPPYFTKILPLALILFNFRPKLQWLNVVFFPLFFSWVFFTIASFFCRKVIIEKTLTTILKIATLGFMIIFLLQKVTWYYHIIPAITCLMLMSSLQLFDIIKRFISHKTISLKAFIYMTCLSFVFLMPIAFCIKNMMIQILTTKQMHYDKFIETVKKSGKGQSVFAFSNQMLTLYPTIDYSNTHTDSYFSDMSDIVQLLLQHSSHTGRLSETQYQNIKALLFQSTIKTLEKTKPKLLLVTNECNHSHPYNKNCIDYFNFVVSHNKKIASILKHYQLITMPKDYYIIYMRIDPK